MFAAMIADSNSMPAIGLRSHDRTQERDVPHDPPIPHPHTEVIEMIQSRVLRCKASGENAYSYATNAKPENTERGYAICPECRRYVKLRLASKADKFPKIIPTHNRTR